MNPYTYYNKIGTDNITYSTGFDASQKTDMSQYKSDDGFLSSKFSNKVGIPSHIRISEHLFEQIEEQALSANPPLSSEKFIKDSWELFKSKSTDGAIDGDGYMSIEEYKKTPSVFSVDKDGNVEFFTVETQEQRKKGNLNLFIGYSGSKEIFESIENLESSKGLFQDGSYEVDYPDNQYGKIATGEVFNKFMMTMITPFDLIESDSINKYKSSSLKYNDLTVAELEELLKKNDQEIKLYQDLENFKNKIHEKLYYEKQDEPFQIKNKMSISLKYKDTHSDNAKIFSLNG